MFEIGTATDYRDLLEKLDTFLTATGSAFGLTYSGTGDGTLTGYKGGSASVADTYELTCIDAENGYFAVGGYESGALANATVGTPYTGTLIQFTINAGATPFVYGDTFTLNTAPPWTSRRRVRGALVTASGGTSGQYACENVIDGKSTGGATQFWSAGGAAATLQFDFPAAVTIASYEIMSVTSYTTYTPHDWTFEYFNGAAWVPLDTRTNITPWISGETKTFTITTPVSAASVRLSITASNATSLYIAAVRLRDAAGLDQAKSQYIWEAPGNDGLSAILVGAHAFQRADVDYYDWELCAFTGFDAALTFYGQPGYHGRLWLPLLNSSIAYWFVADGRCVKVVAKVGSQYESGYLGFLEPYFTPAQAPYPIALGGSLALGGPQPIWNDITYRHSNASNQHRAFTHSDGNTANTLYCAEARARTLDGIWVPFFASHADVFTSPSSGEGWLWPLSQGMTLVDPCADGSYALFPVVLSDSTPNHWGQFSGISVLTGQGLSAETLIRIGVVDYLAVPNITRTDRNDFLAVRLD
jgi:hypothetical protein